MEEDKDVAAIRMLRTASTSRSKTGRMRTMYDEIQKNLDAGVSLVEMHKRLQSNGLDMSWTYFNNVLYRIRKDLKASKAVPAVKRPATATPKEEGLIQPKEDDSIAATEPAEVPRPIPMSAKERREKLADQFIKPEYTNPLIKRFKEKESKK